MMISNNILNNFLLSIYMCSWLCGAATGRQHDYTIIKGHSCNRFDEEEKRKVSDAQRQMWRYEHYYKRFQGHDMSYRAERDKLGPALVENVIKRLELQESVLFQDAAQSLADSHRSLLVGRQVLSRSFIVAYYMFDEDVPTRPSSETPWRTTLAQAKELFQNYQERVAKQVEGLSHVLDKTSKLPEEEKALSEEELEQEFLLAKQKALNFAAAVEVHCGKMYDCIQDELLPMLVEPMVIAAFQKKGPSKAEKELPA